MPRIQLSGMKMNQMSDVFPDLNELLGHKADLLPFAVCCELNAQVETPEGKLPKRERYGCPIILVLISNDML